MKLLWLASWYPNRTSPYNGDFIMRHAQALAPLVEQLTVLSVIKDDRLSPGATEEVREIREHVEQVIIYYGSSRWLPGKAGSLLRSFQLQLRFYRQWCRKHGRPALLHVQVPLKAGLLALFLRRFHQIPYIVSEHWAGYDPASKPGIRQMSAWFRWLNKQILQNAAKVLVVSEDLRRALQSRYRLSNLQVIPNVVDTRIFYPGESGHGETLKVLHVSGMDYQKNPEDMFRALRLWKERGGRFLMDCFGQAPESLRRMVSQWGLGTEVVFHGEVPQPVIAEAMRRADALVLYSRFETFGCVLIEAQACGIPVIVSDLPVFHETVSAGFNGLLVKGEDPEALAAGFDFFNQHRDQFSRESIAARAAERYGYPVVGRQILDTYREIACL